MRMPIFALCLSLLTPLAILAPAAAENAAPGAAAGLPDLAIRVLPKSGSCGEADLCSLVVHLINEGNAPYQGPVTVFLDLHAPAVLPPPVAGGPPCSREDYGKFRCDLAEVNLEPGGYTTIEPEFLFTATAYESSNACASLRWTPHTLAVRDRLLAGAIATSGSSAEVLNKAAGLAGGDAGRSRLLAALLGRWGEGDARSANDISCATIGIVTIRRETPCGSGEISTAGTCKAVAQWCPSNRQHAGAPDRCICPAALAYWNSTAGDCEAQAPRLSCAAPEADPQSCRCPADRPVLNAGKNACVAIEKIAAAAPAPVVLNPAERSVTTQPAAKSGPITETARTEKTEKRKPEPVVEAVKTEVRPRLHRTRTAAVEPEQPPVTVRRHAPGEQAEKEAAHRCQALQVWGPYLHRCLPLPIYLMGRVFAPADAADQCPSGQRAVDGRCPKK